MKTAMDKNIKKLLSGKWRDHYLVKLSVLDHLRECLEKDNYLKATDEPKDSPKYKDLEKELMDLKIILELYFAQSRELYEKRMKKFLSNLNKTD